MKNFLIALFVLFAIHANAQVQEALVDMSSFQPQAGNWQIVGSIEMDRNIDVREIQKSDTSKKRRKKKKKETTQPKAISFSTGTGILLNNPNEKQKDALLTKWEHGDIKLDLEVMIPKGSNSGIYLQGRYELQLLDSWGVRNPKFSDIGGIYRNWEKNPEVMFRGIAPTSNPSKAPGLWQKLHIHFQAPKFDENGNKIANAKFVSVVLNGVTIHSNVEVPLYTGGQISKQETTSGPLMIQGDHGPVAFRNIKYQLLKDASISMNNLSYTAFQGNFKGLEDLENAKPTSQGKTPKINVLKTGEEDNYGIVYQGDINIEEEEDYNFEIGYTGGIAFELDGKEWIKINSPDAQGDANKKIHLTKGSHHFKLTNIKSAGWRAPRLGMTISTSATNPVKFHSYDSYPPNISEVSPIYVHAENTPRMLRAFVDFNGNGKRLSHTIGVGTPNGLNYVYDLSSANMIGAWRGDFVDATPMWHSRGNGSFKPKGAVQWTFLNQAIAQLKDQKEAFPEKGALPDFEPNGYTIDTKTGLPIFKHSYKGVRIENKIIPSMDGNSWLQEVSFSEKNLDNWYLKLASGNVKKMQNGSYVIGDFEYYINMLSGQTPMVREVNGQTELVLPLDGNQVKYEVIW